MPNPGLRRLLAACLLSLGASSGAAELAVIVSAKSTVSALRPDQVADIFLGQIGRYPDGACAVALDQRLGSPLRDEFYTRIAAKTPSLLKSYWTKMVFTGRGQPPQEVADSAAMRKLVAANPALIGYIDTSALDASVKAVLLLR